MRKATTVVFLGFMVLVLVVTGCEGYTEVGARTSENQTSTGGSLSAHINKANGTAEKSIALESSSGLVLEAEVTLSVVQGSYKIELLDADDRATLVLEASPGQSVSGQGQMVTDSFGEAHYRVTAVEAEDVDYSIVYVIR
jgi:predicted alternative tryptophan synthase beta-subunit